MSDTTITIKLSEWIEMAEELKNLREESLMMCPCPYTEEDVKDIMDDYYKEYEPDASFNYIHIFAKRTWYRDILQGAIEIMCENGDECGWRDSIRDAIEDLTKAEHTLVVKEDYIVEWSYDD